MKTITSILGDRWIIAEGLAKPELGTLEFAANKNMMEMLENAQKSEKWANRLRIISKSELNADQNAIYIPDQKNNNWFREIMLEDPCFRTGEHDYFNGYELTWPDDTRLKINECCASPGSYYGPYLIETKREDGSMGLVGYCESESEVLPLLESLKNQELNPLPDFFEHKNVVIDLPDGYKAEINKSVSYYNDTEDVIYPTAIIYPGEAIAVIATMYPDTLLSIRDSAEQLRKVIDECEGRRTKSNSDELKKLNNRLMNFRKADAASYSSQDEFFEAISKLKKDTKLKFLTADNTQEILISWQQVKRWRQMDGKVIPEEDLLHADDIKAKSTDSVRLCFEREYTVQVKQSDGYLVLEGRGKTIDREKLYALISDPFGVEKASTCVMDNGNTHRTFVHEAILYNIDGGYANVEYTSEKTIKLQDAISRVKNEMNKAINSYGMDIA